MKKNWTLFICGIITFTTMAQDKAYTFNLSDADKKIEISSGTALLKVIGYTGKVILISSESSDYRIPDEAKGMKQVMGGFVENTGVGANITRKENTIKIKIPKSNLYESFTIKVPQNLYIKVREYNNNYCNWVFTDLKGELEAKSSFSSITIDKASGPLLIHSDWGLVKVNYDKLNQEKPNAIFSNKEVHVSLPADTKANLLMHSSFGSVFTDFDLVVKDKEEDDDEDIKSENKKTIINKNKKNEDATLINKSYTIGPGTIPAPPAPATPPSAPSWGGRNNTNEYNSDCNCDESGETGTINGGGVKLSLRSDHGIVYLKKKK